MPRKAASTVYSDSAEVDKLRVLEREARLMLEGELTPYLRLQVINQLSKLAAQISAAPPVVVADSDPIEAIRLRTVAG